MLKFIIMSLKFYYKTINKTVTYPLWLERLIHNKLNQCDDCYMCQDINQQRTLLLSIKKDLYLDYNIGYMETNLFKGLVLECGNKYLGFSSQGRLLFSSLPKA